MPPHATGKWCPYHLAQVLAYGFHGGPQGLQFPRMVQGSARYGIPIAATRATSGLPLIAYATAVAAADNPHDGEYRYKTGY